MTLKISFGKFRSGELSIPSTRLDDSSPQGKFISPKFTGR